MAAAGGDSNDFHMSLKLASDLTNIHCCLEKSEIMSDMFFSASVLRCLHLSVLPAQLGSVKDQACDIRHAFGWEDRNEETWNYLKAFLGQWLGKDRKVPPFQISEKHIVQVKETLRIARRHWWVL